MELFHFSPEDIMTATEAAFTFLSDKGIDKKEAMRMKLAAEEVLLKYRKHFGKDAEFKLYSEKRMGTARIILRIAGDSFDPFADLNDEDWLMHNLMEKMGTEPVWSYRRSYNEVVLAAGTRKPLSAVAQLLIAVALGIGLGMLARLLPETLTHNICETWLAPVQNAIMGFLGCLAALFILLSVTSGICGMGDISTFNRVGRTLILRLLIVLLIVVVLSALAIPLFFPLYGGSAGNADFSVLWQMLVDIVPTNIIETFATGNTMQIVFLAIFASVILLVMGYKARQLVEIISQLSELLQQLIQYVIALMPIVVFVSLFRLVADGDFAQLLSAYKYPLIHLLLCAVYLIAHVLIVSLRHHISPLLLVKKLLPTFLIAVSTASSSAALTENLETCENRLGIDRRIINVGLPLGQTLYMPSMATAMMLGVLCTAQIFDVPVSLPAYLILVLTSYILSIASPPIPGSMLVSFALLLTQLGIPSDAMAIIIALDPIIDRVITSTYIAGLQMELIDIGKSLDMLDEQKLRAAI